MKEIRSLKQLGRANPKNFRYIVFQAEFDSKNK